MTELRDRYEDLLASIITTLCSKLILDAEVITRGEGCWVLVRMKSQEDADEVDRLGRLYFTLSEGATPVSREGRLIVCLD